MKWNCQAYSINFPSIFFRYLYIAALLLRQSVPCLFRNICFVADNNMTCFNGEMLAVAVLFFVSQRAQLGNCQRGDFHSDRKGSRETVAHVRYREWNNVWQLRQTYSGTVTPSSVTHIHTSSLAIKYYLSPCHNDKWITRLHLPCNNLKE